MRNYLLGLAILASILLTACETLGYYGQAVGGHLSLLGKRQAISKLLADPATDTALKAKLISINEIRAFAETKLGLPVGKHYGAYVDLDRPFVVWNVFAAPEFSMSPQSWCFPVAGCVSYRGYYRERAARDYARQLAAQGNDVYVGGVAAYSTLGWFTDPVLSSVIKREDWQLASLLFHELAHQLVYAPGDTQFNESFATTVEKAGLGRWLASRATDQAAAVLQAAQASETRQADFVALVQATVSDLQLLYASEQSPEAMRQAKARRLVQLKQDYEAVKAQWGGYAGYDNWFAQDLNNAQLNTVATYNALVPAFNQMLDEVDGNLAAFYQQAQTLAALSVAARTVALDALILRQGQ